MNKLDEWWYGLDLNGKRNAVCNADDNCSSCPLLDCEDCKDMDKVRLFVEPGKGVWLFTLHGTQIKCSKCGAVAPKDNLIGNIYSNYCPVCGAKMEGREME